MTFDPKAHLTDIKGKDYLEVKWRLVWFREEHPEGQIRTEAVEITENHAIFKATVSYEEVGGVQTAIGMGHKSETPEGFPDYIEKAETGAIGRALAALGYGTQFAPELEEGERLADSPVQRKPFKEFDPKDGNASPIVRAAREAAAEHGLPTDEFGPPHPAEEDLRSSRSMADVFDQPDGIARPIPEGGRHMEAKFAGSCTRCDGPLEVGHTIYYHRDSASAFCTECAPEGVTA